MRLIFLGVGSAFSKRHHQTNVLVELNKTNLLIDCGTTAGKSLTEMGKSFKDIDNIFITHIHADHVGGLEECCFMNKFVYHRKPNLIIPKKLSKILWNFSLKGGLELTEDTFFDLDDYFNIIYLKDNATFFVLDEVKFDIFKTSHVPNKICYGLKFGNVFYSGDTVYSQELMDIAKESEIIFHDGQTFSNPVHTSIKELEGLPEEVKAKIHLISYDDGFDKVDISKFGLKYAEQHKYYEFKDVV